MVHVSNGVVLTFKSDTLARAAFGLITGNGFFG